MNKNGTFWQRLKYAAAQLVRDALVGGTGVAAAQMVSQVLDGSNLDAELSSLVLLATLGVWRATRKFILDNLPHEG